ncbi:low specificity L-threonine aldolase, partial [Burkholderia sp. Cy-647]
FSGGAIWPLDTLRAVRDVAHEAGLVAHLDGARLLNASVATGIAAATYAQGWDSAWLDFSKGLGCPVGAVLAGSARFVREAWTWKYRLGGAMRQSGILAAAALHALDHHVEQLADDHAHAALIAARLAAAPGLRLEADPPTNILLFALPGLPIGARAFAERALARGVRIRALDDTRIRVTTHLDVSREDCERAGELLAELAEEAAS